MLDIVLDERNTVETEKYSPKKSEKIGGGKHKNEKRKEKIRKMENRSRRFNISLMGKNTEEVFL